MSINLSIRNYQIIIGGLDCTPAIVSFQGSDSKIDEGGLVIFTGTIVLGRPVGFENLDDRRNTRWSRGTPISIDIANKSGAFSPAPRGSRLFILTAQFDLKTRKLTLRVGDIFALMSFKEGKGDASGICLGTSTAKNDVIVRLLNAAGVTGGLSGYIPGVLQSPTPRLLEGSYVQQAGAIAASSGCFLFVQNGIATVGTLSGSSGTSIVITTQMGLVEYTRLEGEQAPTEVKVRARVVIVKKTEDETETITEEFGPAMVVGLNSIAEILVRRIRVREKFNRDRKVRTITTEIAQAAGLVDPVKLRGSTRLMDAELQIDEYFYEQKAPVKSGQTKCEQGNQGRLMLRRLRIWRPVAVVFKTILESYPKYVIPGTKTPTFPIDLDVSFVDDFSLYLVERTETSYQYDFTNKSSIAFAVGGGSVAIPDPDETNIDDLEKLGIGPKIITTIEKSIGVVLPDEYVYDSGAKHQLLRSYGRLVPVERQTTYYEELKKDEWEKLELNEKGLVLAYPDIKDDLDERIKKETLAYDPIIKLALTPAQDGRKITRSNSGQAQPPAADTYNPAFTTQEAVVKGRATLPVDTAFQYRQKEKEISFEYLSVEGTTPREAMSRARELANQLAREWGVIYWGRYKGVSAIADLADGWFGYRPLSRVNVVEPDGVAAYWGDGFSIAMSDKRAVVGFDGLFLGWSVAQPLIVVGGVPVAQPDLILPPYQQRIRSEFGDGDAIVSRTRDYSLEPIRVLGSFAAGDAISPAQDRKRYAIGDAVVSRINQYRSEFADGDSLTTAKTLYWEEVDAATWQDMSELQWSRIGY